MNHELIHVGEFPPERNEALERAIEIRKSGRAYRDAVRLTDALRKHFGPLIAPQDDRLRAAAQAALDDFDNTYMTYPEAK